MKALTVSKLILEKLNYQGSATLKSVLLLEKIGRDYPSEEKAVLRIWALPLELKNEHFKEPLYIGARNILYEVYKRGFRAAYWLYFRDVMRGKCKAGLLPYIRACDALGLNLHSVMFENNVQADIDACIYVKRWDKSNNYERYFLPVDTYTIDDLVYLRENFVNDVSLGELGFATPKGKK